MCALSLKAGPLTDRDAEEPDEEAIRCPRLALPSHPDAERPLVPASGCPVARPDGLYLHSKSSRTNDWKSPGALAGTLRP